VPVLVFHVSGHGFGHASRSIEVINAVGRRAPSVRTIVCTAAPRWLFELTALIPVELRELEADTGITQHDSLHHDVPGSLSRAAAFYGDFDARVTGEAAFLRSLAPAAAAGESRPSLLRRIRRQKPSNPDGEKVLVVGDIPPLAFAAADAAGIPSYALGNFTWDWIYEGYDEAATLAPGVIERVRSAYSRAREAWRLPLHGGFEGIDRVVDVPLIARHSPRARSHVRRALGLPLDRPLVLSSFGGYGVRGLPLDRVDCLDRFGLVMTETSAPGAKTARGRHPMVFPFDEREIYERGFRYEDLVKAVDVVLSKPGYGIIAECLASDTALVYTSRGQFREYDVLIREMPQLLRCVFLPQEDLFAGRWRPSLERVLAQPAPPTRPRTDGAEVVAARIVEELGVGV
jgi:L-arabinokinase